MRISVKKFDGNVVQDITFKIWKLVTKELKLNQFNNI